MSNSFGSDSETKFGLITVTGLVAKIAFSSTRDNALPGIYVMDEDGENVTQLTDNTLNNMPSWSPNGAKIAFRTDRDGNAEIYVMNADGSSLTRLTNNTSVDQNPTWSPDGNKIAFISDRSGQREIEVGCQ